MDTREGNIILRKKARTELTILRKQLLAQSRRLSWTVPMSMLPSPIWYRS